MSRDKGLERKKKLGAWLLLLIMLGGTFTVGGVALFGGGGHPQPSPGPSSPPVFERNLSSFADALALAPADALRVSYSSGQNTYGTDLGEFINQRHTSWSQVYGSTVTSEVSILLHGGVPLWLHSIAGPSPRAPPTFTYRNATIIEFFPGRQPWLGIVTNSQPFVAGVRPPGPAGPPYLLGLDQILNITEGGANATAWDTFGDLARRLPPGAPFAMASAVPAQGWDSRSVFGVLPEGNESYLAEAYLAGGSPNATRLQELQANATAHGTRFSWNGGGGLVHIEARGNWSQVQSTLSEGGLLPPNA